MNFSKEYGKIFDMHTHSKNSHDSECDVFDMAKEAKAKGLFGFAVTDHCDVEFFESMDLESIAKNSVADAKKADEKCDLTVLKGIEVGEGIWHKNVYEGILKNNEFDVVIASVHAARFENYEMPYSQIDFSKLSEETILDYLNTYFDDVLETAKVMDFDILAHITCPLRYINGKYQKNIDCKVFEEKINLILEEIIKREKALEVNTSCLSAFENYNTFMPENHIIEKYKNMGGYLITLGSDAHVAKNSANGFDFALKFIKDTGFENIYYYKNRIATKCELN